MNRRDGNKNMTDLGCMLEVKSFDTKQVSCAVMSSSEKRDIFQPNMNVLPPHMNTFIEFSHSIFDMLFFYWDRPK